jgi:DNA-binding LacI/PurR family transcriptional regulator
LILPDMTSPLATTIFQDLDVLADKMGIGLIVANSGFSAAREKRWMEALADKGVDVILLWSIAYDCELITHIMETGVPVLQMVNAVEEAQAPALVVDFEETGRIGFRHIAEHGHQQIALIATHRRGIERSLAGALTEAQSLGLKDVVQTIYTQDDGRDAEIVALELLQRQPRTKSLLALDQVTFEGAWRAIRQLGITVPDEIAVVACSDRGWLAHLAPPVTVVQRDSQEIAMAIANTLQQVLETGEASNAKRVFSPRLIIRASCGCDDGVNT